MDTKTLMNFLYQTFGSSVNACFYYLWLNKNIQCIVKMFISQWKHWSYFTSPGYMASLIFFALSPFSFILADILAVPLQLPYRPVHHWTYLCGTTSGYQICIFSHSWSTFAPRSTDRLYKQLSTLLEFYSIAPVEVKCETISKHRTSYRYKTSYWLAARQVTGCLSIIQVWKTRCEVSSFVSWPLLCEALTVIAPLLWALQPLRTPFTSLILAS